MYKDLWVFCLFSVFCWVFRCVRVMKTTQCLSLPPSARPSCARHAAYLFMYPSAPPPPPNAFTIDMLSLFCHSHSPRPSKTREASEEEAKAPLEEWQALMIRKRAERQAREDAAKKSGDSGGSGGGGGRGSPDPKGEGKGSGRSHGSRRSKHEGRMSSRRKKYRRNEFQQMQQLEVRRVLWEN